MIAPGQQIPESQVPTKGGNALPMVHWISGLCSTGENTP